MIPIYFIRLETKQAYEHTMWNKIGIGKKKFIDVKQRRVFMSTCNPESLNRIDHRTYGTLLSSHGCT